MARTRYRAASGLPPGVKFELHVCGMTVSWIWTLLSLEVWHEVFFREAKETAPVAAKSGPGS